jgi:hypothetical protein
MINWEDIEVMGAESWAVEDPKLFWKSPRDWFRRRRLSRKLKKMPVQNARTTLYGLIKMLSNSENVSSRWHQQFSWFERENPQPDSGPYQDLKIQLDCLRAARR